MKTRLMIILLGILFHLNTNAQNYIYKGSEQFEATNTWSFRLNGQYWTSDPKITIAKHSNGGYLMLSIVVPFDFDYIKGNLTIILEDGTMINCIDRGVRDYVDETSTNLYNLTMGEIEKMKISKISKIRFNIFRYQGSQSKGQNMPYTATNYKEVNLVYYEDKDKVKKEYYETDLEITNLFEE
ncbi:MAG: hypothetical protein V4666_09905 [Bacteroidota bacterium]